MTVAWENGPQADILRPEPSYIPDALYATDSIEIYSGLPVRDIDFVYIIRLLKNLIRKKSYWRDSCLMSLFLSNTLCGVCNDIRQGAS
jgi:hypothetical protein